MFLPEYFTGFVHPGLFMERVDLRAREILNFPLVMETVLTEQSLSPQIPETDSGRISLLLDLSGGR